MSSSNENTIIPLETICVIGERWPVAPFNGQFPDPRFSSEVVFYRVDFEYKGYSIKAESNFTVITFKHHFMYKGSTEQFSDWGRGKGGADIARHIVRLVNRLIDLVQATFEESNDNPFPHIRHVGIRDFVSMNSLCGDRRQNLISYAQPAMYSRLAERSVGLVSKINFSTEDDVPKEKNRILRAVELLNCGYHTEALLISFALLDYFVQDAVEKMLKERGVTDPNEKAVGNPRAFLKDIPSRRMQNYLGPLLKILTGHSLQEDNLELWENLKEFNKYRNEAIHSSADTSYEKAKQGIEITRDILLYLGTIPSTELQEVLGGPVVPDLGIDRLPFLLEYEE